MSSYFRQVPNFEYVSCNSDKQNISDYVAVKNLFKRGKIREDIFENMQFFEKYSVIGDERPDNVAYKFYSDETLDWVVLLSNNILDVYNEWPMTQITFDKVMLEKYGSYENLYSGIHHYKSRKVTNSLGITIIAEGLEIPEKIMDYREYISENVENPTYRQEVPYFVEFYDEGIGSMTYETNIAIPVTNYEYEFEIENNKRNIYILKSRYLSVVFNDMEEIMAYKKGGTQYISPTLKRADNIRLYE